MVTMAVLIAGSGFIGVLLGFVIGIPIGRNLPQKSKYKRSDW